MPPHITRRAVVGLVVAVLAALSGAVSPGLGQDPGGPPLLVVISIDGLRPDYVTAADAHGLRIPELRRFMKEGAFAEGVAGVIPTVTYPSHTTLVTGVWPTAHGILANTTFDPLRARTGRLVLVRGGHPRAHAVGRGGAGGAYDREHPVAGDGRRPGRLEHPGGLAPNIADDADVLTAVSTPGLLAEMEGELGRYPASPTSTPTRSARGSPCGSSRRGGRIS